VNYLWLKAFHISAVIIWIGGVLEIGAVAAALVKAPVRLEEECWSDFVSEALWWDRRVTLPAMIVSWSLGLALASIGGWLPDRWLLVKVVFVVLISALHGSLSGLLRQFRYRGILVEWHALRYVPAVMIGIVVAIVSLVIIKPFAI
jgi:protoporphyrinogen IX oxidase